MNRRAKAGLIVGALTAALIGTGTSLALSQHSASTAVGLVTSGELSLRPGDFAWHEATPGLPAQDAQSGTSVESLAGFAATAGDTIVAGPDIDLDADGDNLTAELMVSWPDTAAVPDAAVATYTVTDRTTGAPVAGDSTTPVGAPLTVAGIGERTHRWRIEITVRFAGQPVYSTDVTGAPIPDAVSMGPMNIRLQQVREGQ